MRKRLEEEAQRTTYRLNGVQTGSVIARTSDRYGRWGREFPIDIGVLVRKTASTIYVRWASDQENITHVNHGDARYEVDRGRWKVLGALRGDPLNVDDPLSKVLKGLRQRGFQPLTQRAGDGSIDHADAGTSGQTEEEDDEMAKEMSNAAKEREAAKRQLANGELKQRDNYTAKQVATRCGTDPKTMRKFFRSSHSTVEPVGQGGRYEFAAKDLPKIQKEFAAWSKRAAERNTRKPTPTPPEQIAEAAKAAADEEFTEEQIADAIRAADEQEMAADEDDPSDEDLAELEDLDLDLDDLDALDD